MRLEQLNLPSGVVSREYITFASSLFRDYLPQDLNTWIPKRVVDTDGNSYLQFEFRRSPNTNTDVRHRLSINTDTWEITRETSKQVMDNGMRYLFLNTFHIELSPVNQNNNEHVTIIENAYRHYEMMTVPLNITINPYGPEKSRMIRIMDLLVERQKYLFIPPKNKFTVYITYSSPAYTEGITCAVQGDSMKIQDNRMQNGRPLHIKILQPHDTFYAQSTHPLLSAFQQLIKPSFADVWKVDLIRPSDECAEKIIHLISTHMKQGSKPS
jgi:hypothetical protein